MFFGTSLVFLIFFFAIKDCDSVILPQGRVTGSNNCSDGFRSYLGIPYATVKARYQEAGPPPTWNDTFKADKEVTCKQYSELTKSITGTEDCLAANVYTPSKRSRELLPVIVFVHGGGFYWGSNAKARSNPKYLVEKKVIVATINHRVGAFGFLCLRNEGAQGNVGLKDIIAALRWIKNNIIYFGGNPNSITLWGESSSASATVTLILSQAAQGLFHRAIIGSSTVDGPHFFDRNPVATASEVASRLGFNTTDTDELLAIYRNSPADDIVRASYKNLTNNALGPYVFLPCREDTEVSNNAVITEDPRNSLKNAKELSNISIMMGYNDKEGIFWAANYDSEGLKDLDNNYTKAIPKSLRFYSDESKQLFIQAIRDFYFSNSSTNYSRLIDYYSDVLNIFPSVRTMRAFAANPRINLFSYYFKYSSLRNLGKLKTRLSYVDGASHADELSYIFNSAVNQTLQSDLDFVDVMTTLWTSFAKTGIPSAESITWLPSKDQLQFLQLDKTIKMIDLPNQERINFWKRCEKKYGLQYP